MQEHRKCGLLNGISSGLLIVDFVVLLVGVAHGCSVRGWTAGNEFERVYFLLETFVYVWLCYFKR
jgi:hypothetical protein